MKAIQLKQSLLALALSCSAISASAEWNLNNSQSSLDFISIKKLSIGEVHTFKNLQGILKDNGEVQVAVTLSSVDTGIAKRDERMKKVLFEIVQFPQAMVTTKIDIKRVNALKVGDSFVQPLELTLSIHGERQDVEANMRITSLAGNKLLASTVRPIIVKASEFKLVKGIDKLRELAKLPSISTAVPVTASFIFEK